MTAAPLVPRAAQRAAYGEQILALSARIVDALHEPPQSDPGRWRRLVDEALTVRQPRGEEPVHWLVAALAVQVSRQVPWEPRAGWIGEVAAVPAPGQDEREEAS